MTTAKGVVVLLVVPVYILVLLFASLFASRLQRSAIGALRPLLSLELLLLAAFLLRLSISRANFRRPPP